VAFEVVGYIQVSGSKRSLKIVLNDKLFDASNEKPKRMAFFKARILDNVFYVSLIDVERCIREPKFSAQVVKVKD
jgi:hypothetical protein